MRGCIEEVDLWRVCCGVVLLIILVDVKRPSRKQVVPWPELVSWAVKGERGDKLSPGKCEYCCLCSRLWVQLSPCYIVFPASMHWNLDS